VAGSELLLKNIDIFAKPIQMTYKGKEKFRSPFGGFMSFTLFNLYKYCLHTQDQFDDQ